MQSITLANNEHFCNQLSKLDLILKNQWKYGNFWQRMPNFAPLANNSLLMNGPKLRIHSNYNQTEGPFSKNWDPARLISDKVTWPIQIQSVPGKTGSKYCKYIHILWPYLGQSNHSRASSQDQSAQSDKGISNLSCSSNNYEPCFGQVILIWIFLTYIANINNHK